METSETTAVPRLLAQPDAQRALGGISRNTLWRLMSRGEIVKVNIGTRSFVVAESIQQYIDRQAAKGAGTARRK